jgi:hypothetical protein
MGQAIERSARGQIAGPKSLACHADSYAELSPFVRRSWAGLEEGDIAVTDIVVGVTVRTWCLEAALAGSSEDVGTLDRRAR